MGDSLALCEGSSSENSEPKSEKKYFKLIIISAIAVCGLALGAILYVYFQPEFTLDIVWLTNYLDQFPLSRDAIWIHAIQLLGFLCPNLNQESFTILNELFLRCPKSIAYDLLEAFYLSAIDILKEGEMDADTISNYLETLLIHGENLTILGTRYVNFSIVVEALQEVWIKNLQNSTEATINILAKHTAS